MDEDEKEHIITYISVLTSHDTSEHTWKEAKIKNSDV